MEAFDWIGRALETLTVLGMIVFIIAFVAFLFAAGIYLMRNGGNRASWFTVAMVALFLGGGLSFGMAKAVELLVDGVRQSITFLPELQALAREAIEQAAEPWRDDASDDGTITITEGDVTIVSTPGPMPTAVSPTLTPTPSQPAPEATATATPGDGTGGPGAAPTLTEDEAAATIVAITRAAATATPSPEPTIDFSIWNPMTPAATPAPGG